MVEEKGTSEEKVIEEVVGETETSDGVYGRSDHSLASEKYSE